MKSRILTAFLAVAFVVPSLMAVPYQFNFANLTGQSDASRVLFDGSSDSFSFQHSPGSHDFSITGSDFGDLDGLFGSFSGTFNIGAVSSSFDPDLGVVQEAGVTGLGQFSIFDGSDSITADLTWMNIQTFGTFGGGLNTSGILNLTNFSGYAGSNQRLQSFLSNDGIVTMSMSFQDTDLGTLVLDGNTHYNDFSGSVSVESTTSVADSPLGLSFAAVLLGVIALGHRFRRSGLAA